MSVVGTQRLTFLYCSADFGFSILNVADQGRLPKSWAIARVALIHKLGELIGCRPIRVMSCLYRLWAKKLVVNLTERLRL